MSSLPVVDRNGLVTGFSESCKDAAGPYPLPNTPPGCWIGLFESVLGHKKERLLRRAAFLFYDPERTRTVDLQRDRLAC